MSDIDEFRGRYFFLSNYAPLKHPVPFEGLEYPTSEAAYQAAKSHSTAVRNAIRSCASPCAAKAMGRSLTVRPGWEDEKRDTMLTVVRAKFDANPDLAQRLVQTGKARLIEGNRWGDRVYGCVRDPTTGQWVGENCLGRILEQVRDEHARRVDDDGVSSTSTSRSTQQAQ
ncbi:Domain of unknown function (DUF1768)-containing protein [uncultured virus]|nr:Domain of unknown function (DUF1768)-containing protein [uncultured virus]